MRIKTQIQPASFVPKRPDEFIGYAATVAKVFAAKAKAAKTDRDAKLKYILTGEPGIGKTRLAEFLAEQLTGQHVTDGQSFSVESINGRMIDLGLMRHWRDAGRYVPTGFTVKIINEIDTMPQDKEDALLSFIDELPRKWAVIGTSNRKTSELTPRLQSRLQSFHVLPPTESEIKSLVSRWNIGKANTKTITENCSGNVRWIKDQSNYEGWHWFNDGMTVALTLEDEVIIHDWIHLPKGGAS